MYAGQASMEAAEAVYKLGQIMEEAPLPEPENPEFPKGTDCLLYTSRCV